MARCVVGNQVFPEALQIEIGGKSSSELFNKLRESGCHVSSKVSKVLKRGSLPVSMNARKLNLIRLTVGELGFHKIPVALEVVEEINRKPHFDMCSAEVAPYLRLAYMGKPDQGRVIIFTELQNEVVAFIFYRDETTLCLDGVVINHPDRNFKLSLSDEIIVAARND